MFLLTCIYHFSHWPEVTPLTDISSLTVAQALVTGWISHFRTPVKITTDCGRQFEAKLFQELTKILGSKHIHSISYHPASNDMIERFHRQLKAALCASDSFQSIEFLPIVLLGLRSSIKEDIGYSPAELLYGSSLMLPGQIIVPANMQDIDTTNFVERLRDYMSKLSHMNTRKQDIKTYLPKDYSSWTHGFVHNDAVKHPLTAPVFRAISCAFLYR
ncbi:uncharacterized protein LOC106876921 [Octopus bimaculoides]|uniref:uncharacterized protein LOC106876921 n=1 Tax=Octopus bimaculoides TaxID=37653 RepID=UPI00071C3C53|nr:uncharacterized protein LOC106876921 [Octopus bimaculoides]|eukprot:XP_014781162.1 PREDICTED: uncharacterized protein LOC106876921 [Octopus bimaculoides]